MMTIGLFVIACDSGSSSDNGGTTGGSGDTETSAAATSDSSSNDTASSASTEDNTTTTAKTTTNTPTVASPVTPASSSDIFLDAYTFNCTSNWTNRDGPLGLVAYSGSGTCNKTFPGESGTYKLVLNAVTEFDGQSPYRVAINGSTIKEGTYPLSYPGLCETDCPLENWRSVCPDRSNNIDLGTHTINQGDTIEFWGDDVYPCGEHGSYAKWYGIRAIKQ